MKSQKIMRLKQGLLQNFLCLECNEKYKESLWKLTESSWWMIQWFEPHEERPGFEKFKRR